MTWEKETRKEIISTTEKVANKKETLGKYSWRSKRKTKDFQ
jgi:hypothetical protein